VQDAKVQVIRQIGQSIVASFGAPQVSLDVQKRPLAAPAKAPVPEAPWDLKRWALEFKTPVAVLGATMILCLFLAMLAGVILLGYGRIESRRLRLMEMKEAREQAVAEDERTQKRIQYDREQASMMTGAVITETKSAVKIDGARSGLERFQELYADEPDRATSLIRQWLKAPAPGATEALIAVSRILPTDAVARVSHALSREERREWRKLLGRALDERGVSAAESFMGAQVLDAYLVEQPETSGEMHELIDDITLSEAVELASRDALIGAVLVGLLNPAQVSRMFMLLPQDVANVISQETLKLSDESIRTSATRVREAIARLRAGRVESSSPFAERAIEILRGVGPSREAAIFRALADAGDHELLEAAAREIYPVELILRLPPAILKEALDRLPTEKRAELIHSASEEDKAKLLEAFGKPGTKLYDMITFEIQEVAKDELRVQRVTRNRERLWQEFAQVCRTLVRANEGAGEAAETLLSAWLVEMTGRTGVSSAA
jgi:hypothetical protein